MSKGVILFVGLLFTPSTFAVNFLCRGDDSVYSVSATAARNASHLSILRQQIASQAERDTQLLIFGLEKMSQQSERVGWADAEEEIVAEKQAAALWLALLEKSLWTPLDSDRLDQMELEGTGFLCWKFYAEPSFYLRALMESEGYRRVARSHFLNYYLRHNSYLEIKDRGLAGQSTRWVQLPKGQLLTEEQQQMALEQGKARLKNFETTLLTLSGVSSAAGHIGIITAFSKVLSWGVAGAKGLWARMARLGFVQQRPWINKVMTSQLLWYGSGGVVIGSYIYIIKLRKDVERSIEINKEVLFDPQLLDYTRQEILLRGVFLAHSKFLRVRTLREKSNLGEEEQQELAVMTQEVENDFFRMSQKIENLRDLLVTLELSDEDHFGVDKEKAKVVLEEYIDYVEQYIALTETTT